MLFFDKLIRNVKIESSWRIKEKRTYQAKRISSRQETKEDMSKRITLSHKFFQSFKHVVSCFHFVPKMVKIEIWILNFRKLAIFFKIEWKHYHKYRQISRGIFPITLPLCTAHLQLDKILGNIGDKGGRNTVLFLKKSSFWDVSVGGRGCRMMGGAPSWKPNTAKAATVSTEGPEETTLIGVEKFFVFVQEYCSQMWRNKWKCLNTAGCVGSGWPYLGVMVKRTKPYQRKLIFLNR